VRIVLRGREWLVREKVELGSRALFRLSAIETSEAIEVLCPPDDYELLAEPAPTLDSRSFTPYSIWQSLHDTLRLQSPDEGRYVAFHAGRLSPEPYQFAPLARLLNNPRRSLLIADDVGLGKTIEAGICLLELIARGNGQRLLLVVPPGLIPQWIDEMWDKFGLEFQSIETAASLDRAQTALSDGVQPWVYHERVITSTEYLKRREVYAAALSRTWDAIVVDEAHYLAESGTPANPYSTARARLGPKLRTAARSLILLTATPHNGYRHSFRSLLELVEPVSATLQGRVEDVQRRVNSSMIRRLKSQIVRSAPGGKTRPAFPQREPVCRIAIGSLSDDEREIFRLVTEYCTKTTKAAEQSGDAELVSFAMQIVKKRMLSSRNALKATVSNRIGALSSTATEEGPNRAEIRELQGDLSIGEAAAERTSLRIIRAAVSRDSRRRASERRQLKSIQTLLNRIANLPDPKITALVGDLERRVLAIDGEKAIVFTEYRDSLAALRDAFAAHPKLSGAFVELTGGLSPTQRKAKIARFHDPDCRILLATDAASEGLNLQRQCRRIYHLELPWNPNRLEQRNGRVDRHGQTRPPIISYLFYPDSPEDRVLDRLIYRILQMHDDRVSTPDVLGLLESVRIERIVGDVDSVASADVAAESLMQLFDTRREEFVYQLAPFLTGQDEVDVSMPWANAVTADPVMVDDAEFEGLILHLLGAGVRNGRLPGTFRLDIPRHLQAAGVAARYDCATFRRSIAIQYPAAEVEFVHRLHALSRAAGQKAFDELTVEPLRNGLGSRVAARRHPVATRGPLVVFSYLQRDDYFGQRVLGAGVFASGQILDTETAEKILWSSRTPSGDVTWAECQRVFADTFPSLQETAHAALRRRIAVDAQRLRDGRIRTAMVLREEARTYRVDRLKEIDIEEGAERAGVRDQMELFREGSINWQARRAAVETHYRARIEDIEQSVKVPEPADPQPLGALLVLP
jgi:superfamily II DNA or RNA helicase